MIIVGDIGLQEIVYQWKNLFRLPEISVLGNQL
jgi:hypothetical protein